MESIQAYETTVADRTHAWMARFVIIPERAFPNGVTPTNEDSLRRFFSFATLQHLPAASALPRALAVLVAYDETEHFPVPAAGSPTVSLPPASVVEPSLFQFAEELSFAEVVPFESSPLSLQALASITLKAAKGGAVTLGAVTAIVAIGQTPFLLIAVPAGIVLCGSAISFGKWFDQHRNDIFSKVFGITPRQPKPIGRKIDLSSDDPKGT